MTEGQDEVPLPEESEEDMGGGDMEECPCAFTTLPPKDPCYPPSVCPAMSRVI